MNQIKLSTQLLSCFKITINGDWLDDYSTTLETKQKVVNKRSSCDLLEEVFQAKSRQIAAAKAEDNTSLVLLIVENNAVNFIATFLAGIIHNADIFLGDPAWQKREWQQVLSIMYPDLIFANETTISLINKSSWERDNQDLKLDKLPELINNSKTKYQSLIMIPTGGSSGKIRFAIHNWQTLTASVMGFKTFFNCQTINSFCTLPLYHVSGLMQLMRSLLTAGKLIICPYKKINSQKINFNQGAYFISLVPTQLQYLIESSPDWLKEFKTVLIGGAPPKKSLLDLAKEYQIPLALTYGMTETASGVVALKPDEFLAGNQSNGKVLPHAQITINNNLNAAKKKRSLHASSSINPTGLITINSSSLCLGYYPQLFTPQQPLVTDDLGYFDQDNYLHLVGRNSQKIITGGENVFPQEVEEAIYASKLVKDVCVVGIPDDRWGEKITAIYVPLESNHNLNLIKEKMRSQLARYKHPKNWIAVNTIPRNNRGKVNYQQLKAIAIQKKE